MPHRLHKVNENLKRELSPLLTELGLSEFGLVTVSQVMTSPDLRNATVWLSLLKPENKEKILRLLNSRSSTIYHHLADRTRMKHVPVLNYAVDDKADEVDRIDAILDQAQAIPRERNDEA